MIDLDVITLENNQNYLIIDTIVNENNKYLFLVNEDNKNDIVLRKVIKKDEKEYVTKLDSKDEFEEIMTLFNLKHLGGKDEKE